MLRYTTAWILMCFQIYSTFTYESCDLANSKNFFERNFSSCPTMHFEDNKFCCADSDVGKFHCCDIEEFSRNFLLKRNPRSPDRDYENSSGNKNLETNNETVLGNAIGTILRPLILLAFGILVISSCITCVVCCCKSCFLYKKYYPGVVYSTPVAV